MENKEEIARIQPKNDEHANPQGNHKFNHEDISYLSARKNNVFRDTAVAVHPRPKQKSQIGAERNHGGISVIGKYCNIFMSGSYLYHIVIVYNSM